MNEHPLTFLGRMHTLLGDEHTNFLKCMEQSSMRGIQLNPIKYDEKTLKNALDFPIGISLLSPYPYCIPEDANKPGSIPLYRAGVFCSQEPSAASTVTIPSPQPGEEILDLCAVPGGKSTQIATSLAGRGPLRSNEMIRSCATALPSNLERMSASDAMISLYHLELLCETFSGSFDRILVDTPRSGEGMFRHDAQTVQGWSEEHVRMCAARRGLILDGVINALRGSRILVYSTRTFSPEENEEAVRAFLLRHSGFTLEDSNVSFGRPGIGISQARRILLMDGGDGRFVAEIRRTSPAAYRAAGYPFAKFSAETDAKALHGQIFNTPLSRPLTRSGSSIPTAPEFSPGLPGLGVICAGVMLGEIQKERIEPTHALFLSSLPYQLRQTVGFSSRSSEVRTYLHGEGLEVDLVLKGYARATVNSVMIGFDKCSSGKVKNRYSKSLHSHI